MWWLWLAPPSSAVELGVGARRDASGSPVVDGAELWLAAPVIPALSVRLQADATARQPAFGYLQVVRDRSATQLSDPMIDWVVRASGAALLDADFGIQGPDHGLWVTPHAQAGVWAGQLVGGEVVASETTKTHAGGAAGPLVGMAATARSGAFGVQLATQARWTVTSPRLPLQIVSALDLVFEK